MHYSSREGYTIIKRHYILLILRCLKLAIVLALVGFLYWLSKKFIGSYEEIVYINVVFFLIIFGILNYAFFSFILSLIGYYFNLIVIYKDQIVFIKCTLLFRDDIEVFDSYRIVKVDGFSRGVFANILGFGSLVIEQQKNDVRTFHFVPKPYKIIMIIKKQRESVLSDRSKKYLIKEDTVAEEKKSDSISQKIKKIMKK